MVKDKILCVVRDREGRSQIWFRDRPEPMKLLSNRYVVGAHLLAGCEVEVGIEGLRFLGEEIAVMVSGKLYLFAASPFLLMSHIRNCIGTPQFEAFPPALKQLAIEGFLTKKPKSINFADAKARLNI